MGTSVRVLGRLALGCSTVALHAAQLALASWCLFDGFDATTKFLMFDFEWLRSLIIATTYKRQTEIHAVQFGLAVAALLPLLHSIMVAHHAIRRSPYSASVGIGSILFILGETMHSVSVSLILTAVFFFHAFVPVHGQEIIQHLMLAIGTTGIGLRAGGSLMQGCGALVWGTGMIAKGGWNVLMMFTGFFLSFCASALVLEAYCLHTRLPTGSAVGIQVTLVAMCVASLAKAFWTFAHSLDVCYSAHLEDLAEAERVKSWRRAKSTVQKPRKTNKSE